LAKTGGALDQGGRGAARDRGQVRSQAVREAQLSRRRAKEAEAAEKVGAANDRMVEGLNA
jgi:hypothetical protein